MIKTCILLVTLLLAGCVGEDSTVHRQLPTSSGDIREQPTVQSAGSSPSFIEVLRKSCLDYGKFKLEWNGEQENYRCFRE